MSHVTMAEATFNDDLLDLSAIKIAAEKLGLVFCAGQQEHQWFGRWVNDYNAENAAYRRGLELASYGQCRHAIRLPWTAEEAAIYAKDSQRRPYEIGVVELPNNQLGLVFDAWEGGTGVQQMLGMVGVDCCKLVQLANAYKVGLVAQAAGLEVETEKVGDSFRLELTHREQAAAW